MILRYRPEIDGLRAIAVIAVIVYHAQITIFGSQLFKGGFIGVDIFFIISGYLITSIILRELINTGSFSFKYFYERRIYTQCDSVSCHYDINSRTLVGTLVEEV